MSSAHHLQSLEGSHDQVPRLIPFFPIYDPSPFGFSLHSSRPQTCGLDLHQPLEDHEESSHSSDPLLFMVSLPNKDEDDEKDGVTQQHGFDAPRRRSVKWMSSKMRLMKRMMNCEEEEAIVRKLPKRSIHGISHEQQSPSGLIRVCSDCNTTRTPLWRSGPQGPKSLCNACGIRQRKARKAMAAAAAGAMNAQGQEGSDIKLEEEVPRDGCVGGGGGGGGVGSETVPFKKRSKFALAGEADTGRMQEDSDDGLGKKVFPQDEKEAAILLMALSCGLACR